MPDNTDKAVSLLPQPTLVIEDTLYKVEVKAK